MRIMANQEIKLKDNNGNYLFPQAMTNGIDVNNVLASDPSTYTATEDCIVVVGYNSGIPVSINGIRLAQGSGVAATTTMVFTLKKGDIAKTNDNSLHFKIYGIKH